MALSMQAPRSSTPTNPGSQEFHATISGHFRGDIPQKESQRRDHISYWCKTHNWPPKYFSSGRVTRSALFWSLTRTHSRVVEAWDLNIPSLEPGSEASEDSEDSLHSTRSLWARKLFFRDRRAAVFLLIATEDPEESFSSASQKICQSLIDTEQPITPVASDVQFERLVEKSQSWNVSRIAKHTGPIVAPCLTTLSVVDEDDSLKFLTDSFDQAWSFCVSIHKSYPPKPYYAVGFDLSGAFSTDQIYAMSALDVDPGEEEFARVTTRMCFPFFIVEPTCSFKEAEQSAVANALIGMRGVIELFRAANRAHEVHREVLAFSAVYNASGMDVYAHFADVLDGQRLNFYRHKIFTSSFFSDKWASHKFIKNIYKHHKRICSALETLGRGSGCSSPPPGHGERSHTVETTQSPPPASQSTGDAQN
ncbi:hypothetical protein IWX90DRAFT_300300 [Phyllosticta citrichinensis]|uniref:DUF7924 domain-containing protein n=1 Tax=Phyllosticta citrichinensis TaxID=1130410 RepID=A0ABR1XL74_9PEZI